MIDRPRIHLSLRLGLLLTMILLTVACAPTSATSPVSSAPGSAPATIAVPSPSPVSAAPSRSPTTAASPAAVAGATAATVTMTDALKFEPATLTVARGTTVTWHNGSQTQHTVTDDPAKASNAADAALPSGAQAWDSGTLNAGQSFSHTFDTPGTYRYFCIPHEAAGMTATIIVTG